jgi:methionyl-tRNA formyltransferase
VIDGRIVFIGESRFSREMLKTLLEAKRNVVAVFSRAKREGMDDCDDLLDMRLDIPHFIVKDINDHVDMIDLANPDVIFCLGFRQIIKKPILDICPVIGYHPSPLPEMRGPHPIIWALLNRINWTASTFFLMDEGMDSGDILSQIPVPVYRSDTVKTLYDRLIDWAKEQMLTLDLNNRIPQDHSKATYLRKRVKGEEEEWLEY